MSQAEFHEADGTIINVRLKRQGRKNSRVVFDDGHEELIPNDLLQVVTSDSQDLNNADPRRIVPETPLRRLYRDLRQLRGSRQGVYESLVSRLEPLHGPPASDFLAELFARSRAAMEFYHNPDSNFYQRGRRSRLREKNPDARALVHLFSDGSVTFEPRCASYEYVDYEICPIQTTLSCLETGKPAKRSGSGGMDLLLISAAPQSPSASWTPLPAVGEVKAATECVGPTFALVQGLVYAAELTSTSQWARLGRAFASLGAVCTSERHPQVDLVLLLQQSTKHRQQAAADLEFAQRLSSQLIADSKISRSIRRIEFVSWRLEGEQAILSQA